MADLVFNIAKGRVAQLAMNVDAGSPANSRLILIPFNNDGSSTDDNVRDADTVAAVEALSGVTERTANGWGRKTLAASDVTVTVDDTNNRVDIDIPDQTWTAVTSDAVTDLLIAYDADNTAGTDSDLIPLTWHDFAVTPDGSDVTAVINAAGFFRAS
jgi:hypothetical protein